MLCTFINFIGIGKSCLATAHSKTKPLGGRDRENMIVKSIFSFIFYSVFLCVSCCFSFISGGFSINANIIEKMGSERCGCGSCGLNFTIFSKYIKDNANSAKKYTNMKEKKPQHNRKTQSDDETKKNYNNPPKYEC